MESASARPQVRRLDGASGLHSRREAPLNRIWTTPNVLTIARLAALPLVVLLLLSWDARAWMVALGILCFTELTDLTDGFIARDQGETSAVGKLLDPLADSVTRVTLFMTFLAMGLVPLAIPVIVFLREHIVAYYRTFAATRGVVLAARPVGKAKSAVQVAATLWGVLLLVLSEGEVLGGEQAHFTAAVVAIVSVLYVAYAVFFRLRGWVLWVTVAFYPAGLGPVAAMWMGWIPPFDPVPAITGLGWVAAVVTLLSLVDYTRAVVAAARVTAD